ncbi:MAG TPA: aldehyde dehydrogenase family protein, partial [Pilimelia sp.]|nr:aldehyde dehydrogenase family protein [Pilimelia sp.]
MVEVEQLLGGVWGAGGVAGQFIVTDPADGGEVSRVPEASESDVAGAVKAARSAAPGWARTAAGERAA